MSAGFDFDPDQVSNLIAAAVETFDFTLPGKDQSLGRDLAVIAATGIQQRSNRGRDVDGVPFAPNEARYAADKLKRFGVDRPGELSGQMLSLQSVLGRPVIGPDSVEMAYGLDAPPSSSTARSGAPLRPSELKATDREKAGWFEGSGREFYGFDPAIEAEVQAEAERGWERHVRDLGLA